MPTWRRIPRPSCCRRQARGCARRRSGGVRSLMAALRRGARAAQSYPSASSRIPTSHHSFNYAEPHRQQYQRGLQCTAPEEPTGHTQAGFALGAHKVTCSNYTFTSTRRVLEPLGQGGFVADATFPGHVLALADFCAKTKAPAGLHRGSYCLTLSEMALVSPRIECRYSSDTKTRPQILMQQYRSTESALLKRPVDEMIPPGRALE